MRSRFVAALLCVLLVSATASHAQTTAWNVSSGNWSTNSNWTNNAPTPTGTADFGSTSTSTVDSAFTLANLNLGGGSVTINSSGGSLDVTGAVSYGGGSAIISVAISGVGTLNVSGSSALQLNALNTYSGLTTVASGTLTDTGGAANSFSPNSLLLVSSPGTVQVTQNETVAGLDSGGNGSIVIGGGKTLSMSGGFSSTFSGVISGPGGIANTSAAGTLILTGTNTYTGPTAISTNAGIEIGNGGAGGSIASSGVSGAGSLGFDLSVPYTYAGALTGSLNVVQSGATGTTTLSGANNYSGTTTVLAGTLQAGSATAFGDTGSSSVTVDSGATLSLNNFNITVGTLAGAGTVSLGTGTLTLANSSGETFFSGTISGTGTGGLTANEFSLVLTNSSSYLGTTTILGSGSTLVADNASGNATGFGPISIGTGASLLLGQNDAKGFIYSGSVIAISSGGKLEFFQAAGTYPIGNNIDGAGGIEQAGSGTTVLTNTNAYSGPTEVFSGTLQAGPGNTNAFGSGQTSVTFDNDGTLDLNGNNITVGSVSGTVTTGGILLSGGAILTIGDSITDPILSAPITGTGGIVLGGSSTGLILTGISNTYSGGTTISDGTLLVANPSGFATGTGPISIGPSAILEIGASAAAGAVDPTSAITDNGSINFSRSDATSFPNAISGSGGLNVILGTVTFPNGNLYSGLTQVSGGTLIVDNTAGFATGTGSLAVDAGGTLQVGNFDNGGDLDPSSVVNDNGSVVFTRNDSSVFANQITGSGTVTFNGSGTVVLSGGNNYTGLTSVNSGTLGDGPPGSYSAASIMLVNTGATLRVSSDETVAGLVNGSGGGNVTFLSGASLTSNGMGYAGPFEGFISGNGSIVVANNEQGFSGINTYTGGTTVENNAELWVGSNNALGTGTLTFDGANTELSPSANVTLPNNIVLDSLLDNDDGDFNLTLTGVISGSSEIEWCQPTLLALTNANTFTGGVDMREGTLLLGSDTAAGTGTITLDDNTTLSAYGGPGVVRNVPNDINFTGSAAQFGSNDNNNLTLSGTLSGEAAVAYDGGPTGTLTITSDNSSGFFGSFTIQSGTVIAGNTNAFGSSENPVILSGGVGLNVQSGVTVNNPLTINGLANTLSGNGTIGTVVDAGSNVIISASSGTGGVPGNLTFGNVLQLDPGATISFHLYDANGAAGTGFSLITAIDGIDLSNAGAASIAFNLFSVNAGGSAAAALNFNSGTPYSWTFATTPTIIIGFAANQFVLNATGFANGTGGGTFSFSQVGNNLDLNFTPVPEPSTWALMGTGVLAAAAFAVRRRRIVTT
jgi:fibronectin-binding autotransporter adhesin